MQPGEVPYWTDAISGQLLTATRLRNGSYRLYAICAGEPVSLGTYPSHPALLGGLQTWAGYLNGGGSIATWFIHHVAGAYKQYAQTMDPDAAFAAAIRVSGMTPAMARKIANDPAETAAFMLMFAAQLDPGDKEVES